MPSNNFEMGTLEPHELVRRVQMGCQDSATELVHRYMPRLQLLLERRMPGRTADAEDIAQEAMARAFHGLSGFDFTYRFSTWLYTIAFRLATDLMRKERRRPKTVSLETSEVTSSEIAVFPLAQDRDQPDNLWSIAQKFLSESQFTVIWLRYGEGMSVSEIATVLNKTQISVRVQLHRAREKLSGHLNHAEEVESRKPIRRFLS
jgi:RNA polymerase sigma-70 factor (ECF subfamily)